MKTHAHLKESSPFYPLFPNGRAPIIGFVAELGVMEGDNGNRPQEFYRLDVAKLDSEQFARICHLVAAQCGGVPEEVSAHLRKEGFIPLRAIHVTGVSTDSRDFL